MPTRDAHLSLLHLVDFAEEEIYLGLRWPRWMTRKGCGRKRWLSSGVRTGFSKKVEWMVGLRCPVSLSSTLDRFLWRGDCAAHTNWDRCGNTNRQAAKRHTHRIGGRMTRLHGGMQPMMMMRCALIVVRQHCGLGGLRPAWQYEDPASGLTRVAVFACEEVPATRSGDQGSRRPSGQFVQVSSDLWLLPSITPSWSNTRQARGVRSQDRDKVHPPFYLEAFIKTTSPYNAHILKNVQV